MRSLLLILSIIVFPAFAQDELSAKAWLDKMSQALQQTQFKASMIEVQSDHIRPLVYLHGVVNKQEVAFLEYLNGPPQKAIRVGEQVTFLENEQPPYSVKAQRIDGLWPQVFAEDINLLSNSYQFVLGGRNRIAGRPGQLVRIIPNDDFRYGYQLWLDMENYLPLRLDTISSDKHLLEQLMVIEMGVMDETPEILQEAADRNWPSAAKQLPHKSVIKWKFNWLPKGFKVLVQDHHSLYGSRKPVEYIGISDGIANISVYIARAGDTELPEALNARNGLSVVTDKVGDAEVVVIGQVPTETLTSIAKSLTLAE
ncbi:MucB/RseB [Shewanella sp. OPT22]|nr:MucB/RseB [Shewanella sp. OPT22]